MLKDISEITISSFYHDKAALSPLFLENMFFIMLLIFLAFFAVLAINLRDIREYLPRPDRRTLAIFALILAAGFVLRNAEYMYQSGLDGIHYTETARTWLETGIYLKGCGIGDISDCRLYLEALFPAGFPFVILLLYMAFGVNTLNVMILNGIVGSLNILLVYVISQKLFRNSDIALYSSLIFSLVPIDIMISGSGAVRTTSLFMIGLTVIFFLMSMERDKIRNWLLFSMAFSLSIYFRQENSLLIVPLVFLFLFRYGKSKPGFLLSRSFIIPASLLAVTQIPVQHWILFTGGLSPPGMPDFSLHYLLLHLPWTAGALFFPSWIGILFSPVASSLFLLSAAFLVTREKVSVTFLWVWFLSFFLLYTAYFYCPTLDCPEYPRYLSALGIPYSCLAALPVYWASKRFRIRREYLIPVLFISLALSSGIQLPQGIFQDKRADEPYVGKQISAISTTPPECTILVNNYMAAGSDVLENRRRWVDLEFSGFYAAISEVKNAACLIIVDPCKTRDCLNNKYPFVRKHLETRYYDSVSGMGIFNATPRDG